MRSDLVIWAGNDALKQKFAGLYNVSSQKKEFVVNMGWYEGEA